MKPQHINTANINVIVLSLYTYTHYNFNWTVEKTRNYKITTLQTQVTALLGSTNYCCSLQRLVISRILSIMYLFSKSAGVLLYYRFYLSANKQFQATRREMRALR